jgi:acyl phosphate:glycerol-3-phosphate acyltransferase
MLAQLGHWLIAAMLGYIIGAFPSGVMVTRLLQRPDVRTAGSGHTGGLNTFRQAGIAGAALTVLLDLVKGALAAWLALKVTGNAWALPVAGVAAVIGHCWPVYLGFSGGMGLSTLGGLFFWQQPLAVLIAAALWWVSSRILHDSPRGVIVMSVLMIIYFLIIGWFARISPPVTVLGIAGVGVIFVRHLTQLPVYDRRAAAKHTKR